MGKPSGFAMTRAAEEIGPAVLVKVNQKRLAELMDKALEPIIGAATKELRDIDGDERFHYPTATTDINAPLALVQISLESRVDCLQRLLRVVDYDGPEMRIRKGPRK